MRVPLQSPPVDRAGHLVRQLVALRTDVAAVYDALR